MIYKHPETVVKAIDFVTYGCSGWACIAAYVNHYSTLFALGIAFCSLLVSIYFKQVNYSLEKKKLEVSRGIKTEESS
mgnify:FL=1|jgi:uncharacterized membrane protein YdbT with pleckstrin-like domain|tara:strand:- start:134 stop:364 length:231 start_codon:yes stop_codon:yes gene_type:complete